MRPYDLTPREREAAQIAAKGLSNREVAARMSLTEGAVKQYLNRAFEKLGVEKRGQLTYSLGESPK